MGNKSLYVLAAVAALTSIGSRLAWKSFVEYEHYGSFFQGRTEWFAMHSMPGWLKRRLANATFISKDVREVLASDPTSHVAHVEWYDPEKHDTSYRTLRTDFLTPSECASIRSILERNALGREDAFEGDGDHSLFLEFAHKPVSVILGLDYEEDLDVTEQEKKVISDVLRRLQQAAEDYFQTDSIFLEFADLTRRRVPEVFSSTLSKLYYLSTGGHTSHTDMCQIDYDSAEAWSEGFQCIFTEDHCCAHGTHSVLLYLNDPESDLAGGEFFIVDRKDLKNESEPSFSGEGLNKLFRNVLKVKPHCGNLMMFTSDARNIHGVFPITHGTRFAMPMWFTSLSHLVWTPSNAHVVKSKLEDVFWRNLASMCTFMGKDTGFATPSMFKKYIGDCETMLEAAQTYAYYRAEDTLQMRLSDFDQEEDDYGEEEDEYYDDEDEYYDDEDGYYDGDEYDDDDPEEDDMGEEEEDENEDA